MAALLVRVLYRGRRPSEVVCKSLESGQPGLSALFVLLSGGATAAYGPYQFPILVYGHRALRGKHPAPHGGYDGLYHRGVRLQSPAGTPETR